jgi:hypothetical protein
VLDKSSYVDVTAFLWAASIGPLTPDVGASSEYPERALVVSHRTKQPFTKQNTVCIRQATSRSKVRGPYHDRSVGGLRYMESIRSAWANLSTEFPTSKQGKKFTRLQKLSSRGTAQQRVDLQTPNTLSSNLKQRDTSQKHF